MGHGHEVGHHLGDLVDIVEPDHPPRGPPVPILPDDGGDLGRSRGRDGLAGHLKRRAHAATARADHHEMSPDVPVQRAPGLFDGIVQQTDHLDAHVRCGQGRGQGIEERSRPRPGIVGGGQRRDRGVEQSRSRTDRDRLDTLVLDAANPKRGRFMGWRTTRPGEFHHLGWSTASADDGETVTTIEGGGTRIPYDVESIGSILDAQTDP